MLAHQFGFYSLFFSPLLFLFDLGAYEHGFLDEREEDWEGAEANRIQA